MEKLLGLPELASQHGADVDKFIVYVHWLMIALFIGWGAYFLYALWRFRAGRNQKADYVGVTSHASSYLEVAVAAVEILLLVGFAIPLWAKVVDKFPTEKESVLVRITGQQFAWGALYTGPDGKYGKQDIALVSSTNPMGRLQMAESMKAQDPDGKDDVLVAPGTEILVPVGRPVIASITSLDVIHSFKVPALRTTQDAIPGLRLPTHFVATKTGNYQINCAQLCGIGHSTMKGSFRVVSTNEFDAWLKTKAAAAPAASFE
jgi:cytochrome c oxidase subunit 2